MIVRIAELRLLFECTQTIDRALLYHAAAASQVG